MVKEDFKVKITGKFKLERITQKKICKGVYFFRVIFDEPKHFELVNGDTITVIPLDDIKSQLCGVIEIEFESENEKVENYRVFSEGSRYIIDVILIEKSLMEE